MATAVQHIARNDIAQGDALRSLRMLPGNGLLLSLLLI